MLHLGHVQREAAVGEFGLIFGGEFRDRIEINHNLADVHAVASKQ